MPWREEILRLRPNQPTSVDSSSLNRAAPRLPGSGRYGRGVRRGLGSPDARKLEQRRSLLPLHVPEPVRGQEKDPPPSRGLLSPGPQRQRLTREEITERIAAIGDVTSQAHLLHERFWAQVMIVLQRSGRSAGALAAYDRVRRILAEETGLDPGAELRDIQQTILTGGRWSCSAMRPTRPGCGLCFRGC